MARLVAVALAALSLVSCTHSTCRPNAVRRQGMPLQAPLSRPLPDKLAAVEQPAYRAAVDKLFPPVAPGVSPNPGPPAGGGAATPRMLGTALTVGAVFLGLKSVIGDVEELGKKMSGEAKTLLAQLDGTLLNLADQMQRMLGDDMDHLVSKLDDSQRRFVDGVQQTVMESRRAAQAIAAQVADSSLVLVHEADITAYDTLHAIPGSAEAPRIVYWRPKTYYAAATPQLLEVRGNFLDVRAPAVKVDGAPVEPVGTTRNGIQLLIPPPGSLSQEAIRQVAITCTSCAPRPCLAIGSILPCDSSFAEVPSSFAVTMRPEPRYLVKATIQPKGRQLERASLTFSGASPRREDDKCDRRYDDPQTFYAAAGWEWDTATTPPLDVWGVNCRSGATAALHPPNAVLVSAWREGCGYFLGIDCNGRGWVQGFSISIPAKRKVEKEFLPQAFEAGGTERTYSFRYDTLPPDSVVEDWWFWVTVVTPSGEKIELSHASPSVLSAHARIVDGTLGVSLDEPITSLVRERVSAAR